MAESQTVDPKQLEKEIAAAALTDHLKASHSPEDVLGTRPETTGDLIAVTKFGNKVRITTDGEVQVLMGPGMPATPDVYEPPEIEAPAVDVDLPPALEGNAADDEDEPDAADDTFEVFKGEDKEWYIRQVAPNGEVVLISEGHKRLKDAMEEAERVADGRPVNKVKV